MFIKATKNRHGKVYYQVVESYRDAEHKTRHRVLMSLGEAEEGKLEALSAALSKHTSYLSALEVAKSMSIDKTYWLGPLLVLEHLFEKLGIDSALSHVQREHPKLEIDIRRVCFSLVAARLIKPCSKLRTYESMLEKLDPRLLDTQIAFHHLYRVLDVLSKDKDKIEKALYWHGRDLFTRQVDIVLYDLTTLHFESTRQDLGQLRRFGYSKNKRSDCVQVVLGLLVDTDGIPLGFEVYPGNTWEGISLPDIVKKMREKFAVRRFIFVADRGLFSEQNLATLEANKGEYIVGMRVHPKKQTDLYDPNKLIPLLKDEYSYHETTCEDMPSRRVLVTWSKARAQKDRTARTELLEKIRARLSKKNVSAALITHRGYKRFVKETQPGKAEINLKAVEDAAKTDGFFTLVTNVQTMSSAELLLHYKELWKIEDAFGELKGTLQARPIFHSKDARITGHLVICFLAQLCEAHIQKTLRHHALVRPSTVVEQRPLTAAQCLLALSDVCSIPVDLHTQRVWIRTDIHGHAATLFKALGIRIPPKLLAIYPRHADTPVVAPS